jgi:hypothetical protein
MMRLGVGVQSVATVQYIAREVPCQGVFGAIGSMVTSGSDESPVPRLNVCEVLGSAPAPIAARDQERQGKAKIRPADCLFLTFQQEHDESVVAENHLRGLGLMGQ